MPTASRRRRPAVRRVVGLPLLEAIATLLPEHGPDVHIEIREHYKSAFHAMRIQPDHIEPLYPGVIEALDALEGAGFLLGVATGKSRRGLNATLDRHGLVDRFVTLKTSDDGPGKPSPHMMLAAMDDVGVGREAAVMVGDTTFDMLMARSAGAAAVGVSWGYHEIDELTAAGADQVIHGFADLLPVTQRLLGG